MRGTEVAWRGEAGGGTLVFFGQAYQDIYATQNIYWLRPGPGLAMGAADRSTAAVAADPWFWETAVAEKDLYYVPYAVRRGGGRLFRVGRAAADFAFGVLDLDDVVALVDAHTGVKTGTVTAHLISAYDGAPVLDNRTRLWAAGQLLDDRQWRGDERLSQTGAPRTWGAPRFP
jgi:hypothetical protein